MQCSSSGIKEKEDKLSVVETIQNKNKNKNKKNKKKESIWLVEKIERIRDIYRACTCSMTFISQKNSAGKHYSIVLIQRFISQILKFIETRCIKQWSTLGVNNYLKFQPQHWMPTKATLEAMRS